jgi:hypothetical protein
MPLRTLHPAEEKELRARLQGPLTQRERVHCEAKLDMHKVITAPTDIGEEQSLALRGQMLSQKHFELLLDKTGIVERPDFEPLCILLKGHLPQDLLDRVRPILRSVARQSVASGNRVDAAGAGRGLRRRRDGSTSKITGVPRLEDMAEEHYLRLKSAKDGTVGYNAQTVRGGQKLPCRLTSWTQNANATEWRLMSELAEAVGEAFKHSCVNQEWERQSRKAKKTLRDFVMKTSSGITPFTTITVNKSWPTAAHIDATDLKQGFGVMCSLGDFEGCDLVFPRYKTAVRYREGDILLADVANQVHGNTPLLNPDGSEPEPGEEPPERFSCVFYYQEKMEHCHSPEEEMGMINRWERGQSSRKKK